MTIDMHSHWRPASLADALRKRTALPRIVRNEDGVEVLESRRGIEKLFYDNVEERLETMDRLGIDAAMISMQAGFGWMERLPVEESLPLVQLYNDSVSQMCEDHAPRFTAVAALPLRDLSLAAEEFERVIELPGIIGACLPGDGFLTYERAQTFRPLLEIAHKHSALIFIHRATLPGEPDTRPKRGVDNFVARDSTLDMQSTLSAVMVTLCLTDLLDPYPDATILTHNLGGNIPFEVERMDHRAITRTPSEDLPSARFRRSKVMVDCNSLGSRAIELAVEVYGADRIVFGADGSSFGAEWLFKALRDARISDADRQAILHDNAASMLASLTRA